MSADTASTTEETFELMPIETLSRRRFLTVAGAAPLLGPFLHAPTQGRPRVPIGLEMFSLREEEKQDRLATLRAVAEMGYDLIEQEGSRFSPLETARRCLENFRSLRG